jgi:hypothetical protein
MISKSKAFGTILMVALVMSGLAASTASAGAMTSTGKTRLTGEDTHVKLTAFGLAVECPIRYDMGNANETPHGLVSSGATTFTMQPTFLLTCASYIGETLLPTTVTMNGCDFVVHIGSALGVGFWYKATTDIVCPAGKEIELHAYTNVAHATTVCTVKVPAQTGLGNGTLEVFGNVLELKGPIKGIKATKTGILCGGTAETSSGEQDITAVISGTNEAGAATAISLSGS